MAASEASSGVRSGRVCLKVAASLSSLGLSSCCRSARGTRDGKMDREERRGKEGQSIRKKVDNWYETQVGEEEPQKAQHTEFSFGFVSKKERGKKKDHHHLTVI